jgi:hypothetical protein
MTRLRLALILCVTVALPAAARADITTVMGNAWDYLPVVQISQGRSLDCNGNRIVYNTSMTRPYSATWPGTGVNGDDICWRRSSNPSSANSDLGPWTRCAASSTLTCTID